MSWKSYITTVLWKHYILSTAEKVFPSGYIPGKANSVGIEYSIINIASN